MNYHYKVIQEMNPTSLETRINEYANSGYKVIHFSPPSESPSLGKTPCTTFYAVLEIEVPNTMDTGPATDKNPVQNTDYPSPGGSTSRVPAS